MDLFKFTKISLLETFILCSVLMNNVLLCTVNLKFDFCFSQCSLYFNAFYYSAAVAVEDWRTLNKRQEQCSVKKVFLKISQSSQGNTCIRVSFSIKLQREACNFIKKKFLRTFYRIFLRTSVQNIC